jgi:hypothetical protein
VPRSDRALGRRLSGRFHDPQKSLCVRIIWPEECSVSAVIVLQEDAPIGLEVVQHQRRSAIELVHQLHIERGVVQTSITSKA